MEMYNILICDDERDIVNALKIYLNDADYTLFEAFTGREALKIAEEKDIHLVLMDIMMPEMDGIQALKEIKKIDGGAKVIMCSAMGQQAMVVESIQAGAKDFIVKPFQEDRVLEAVKKVIG